MAEQEIKTVEALQQETNEQISQRKNKLAELRAHGNAYPNGFERDSLAADLQAAYGDIASEDFEAKNIEVKVAGRIMTRRIMGKASFTHIQDMTGKLQLYIARDSLPEGLYQSFKGWDLGDIIAAEGVLFKTILPIRISSLAITRASRTGP